MSDFEFMSESEFNRAALREYAYVYGEDRPDVAWISTPYDTWEPNPFYRGRPVPHPEDYDPYLDEEFEASEVSTYEVDELNEDIPF